MRRSRPLWWPVVVAGLALVAACGGEPSEEQREPAPRPAAAAPQQDSATPESGGQGGPRDRFSLRAGQLCSRFYADAAPLQAQLQSLGPRVQSDRGARDRAGEIIDRIQAGSRAFLRRIRSTPPPSSPRARQDKTRLLASIETFVGLQRDNLDVVEDLLARPDRVSAADQRRVRELRSQLGAELVEQQALLRRLDVPECLPS